MSTLHPPPTRLLDRLLALEPELRGKALRSPRFHRLDLLDLLLTRSGRVMDRNPHEAGRLARLAVDLGLACRSAAEDLPVRSRLVTAFTLTGDAHRLAGERELAEAAFDGAAFFLSPGGTLAERARVCRSVALLRWQRGRVDEAAALLAQSALLYEDGGEAEEEGVSLALLGILHMQENEPGRALEPLTRARPILGERRPWLTARALLSLALCLADEGRIEESQRAANEASHLSATLTDPIEKARALWLHGRLSARTGSGEPAEGRLMTAITRLVTYDRLPEATLAALDLMVLYAETGQSVRVQGLPRRLSSEPRKGLEILVQALQDLLEAIRMGIDPRKAAVVIGAGARQVFRFLELKVDALPWV